MKLGWLHHCYTYALISCLVIALAPWGVGAAPQVTVTSRVCVQNAAPPVITQPANGSRTGHQVITVAGTGAPTEQLRVTRNGSDAGSTTVGGDGRWSLPVTLVVGSNTLVASGCYESAPVTVTWQPGLSDPQPPDSPAPPVGAPPPPPSEPVPPAPGTPSQPPPPPSSGESPQISSPDSQLAGRAGRETGLNFTLRGDSPFDYVIDWGDGTSTRDRVQSPSEIKVFHTYDKAGRFLIKLTVTDAKGRVAVFQFVATIDGDNAAPGVTQPPDKGFPWAWVVKISLVWLILLLWLLLHRRHKDKDGPCHHHLMRPLFRSG